MSQDLYDLFCISIVVLLQSRQDRACRHRHLSIHQRPPYIILPRFHCMPRISGHRTQNRAKWQRYLKCLCLDFVVFCICCSYMLFIFVL